ncbi:olfactory receptor 5F1-like [Engystomops pustulosus]|uniref:olfactory receptor 5F1-like n=1 Tax=Engystomops pustulosus TaxID=76066 RepID=UPI003AFA8273
MVIEEEQKYINDPSDDNRIKWEEAIVAYEIETEQRAIKIKTKINDKIFREGSRSGKILASLIRNQNEISYIAAIKGQNNRISSDNGHISKISLEFYTELYDTKITYSSEELGKYLQEIQLPQLKIEEKQFMELPITKEEIKWAIDNMKTGKAPGLDSLPVEIYITYRDSIIPNLHQVYKAGVPFIPPMAIEPLASIIKHNDCVKGIQVGDYEEKIVLFADDVLLTLSKTPESLSEVLEILKHKMNGTLVTEFVLAGLSSNPDLQLPLFLLFSVVYMVTLLGNLIIIVLIRTTPGLQTPMYFFLMNLSLVDVLYSSTITPNTMVNIFSEHKTISFIACAIQMFLFINMGSTEGMLLAVMAYDRYVAICKPLYYTVIMNKVTCIKLVCSVFTAGCLNSLLHTCAAFSLPFCHSNHINHFYCDINPILRLSCKDTFLNQIFLFVFAGSIEVGSFLCIVISYSYIIFSICRIGLSGRRHKSLSTCISHFTCVALFYFPIFSMYLRPNTAYAVDQDWVLSVFYTVITPMLNPMIYSLRNQDVKQALVKFEVNKIYCLKT